jgi:hypothetical protein
MLELVVEQEVEKLKKEELGLEKLVKQEFLN